MSEPWLGGPIEGVSPLLAPVLYTFAHVRQEAAACVAGLTAEQIWSRPHGLTPLGFHLRHIGGAADRLSTYLRGEQLTAEQMATMRSEAESGPDGEALLAALDASLSGVEALVRGLDPSTLADPRGVGRKMLPTTVNGLLVHIAEHSQRHLGQAVTTAKLVRALAG